MALFSGPTWMNAHCLIMLWTHTISRVVYTMGDFVVVVVVYFIWFSFHGKNITNANHKHNHNFTPYPSKSFCSVWLPLYYAWLTIVGVVVHAYTVSLERGRSQGLGWKVRRQPLQHYNPKPTRIMKLWFSLDPKTKPMIDCELGDGPTIDHNHTKARVIGRNCSCGWLLWLPTNKTTTNFVRVNDPFKWEVRSHNPISSMGLRQMESMKW